MRLSQAKIPTILLVGNHDISPATGRAHAIQEFETLDVPFVRVIAKPVFLGPDELGIPLQVIGLPWVSRSGLMASLATDETTPADIFAQIEQRLTELVAGWLEQSDPALPVIMIAHASVQGATFGAERMVMLGADLVLPGSLVKNPLLDYVAMGHIHKPQNLNGPGPDPKDKTAYIHPPVIYPGSIERLDFGEAKDDKFFMIIEVEKGHDTKLKWRKLKDVRKFIECYAQIKSPENVTAQLKKALPKPEKMVGAIVKLSVEYPRDYEKLIDENELRAYASETFEFHLVKRPQVKLRVRLAEDQNITSLTPLELLNTFWEAEHTTDAVELEALQKLAAQVLDGANQQLE
jgi:exonuclease SbcD